MAVGEGFQDLHSLKKRIVMNHLGTSDIILYYEKKPFMFRMETSKDDVLTVNAFDGTDSWKKAGNQPAKPQSEYIHSFYVNKNFPFGASTIIPLLANPAYYNAKVDFLQKIVIDEQEYYELEYKINDKVFYFYVNTDSDLLEIRSISRLNPDLKSNNQYTLLKEYHTTDGYTVSHKIEIWLGGGLVSETIIQDIEFNPELPDSLFAYPNDK
jgi:hypothetical protein